MPSKYQIISELAARETLAITSNAARYTAFLNTAAQNYKYRFQDQLLIHAQKPEATACAEIDLWNKLGRWVNKGAKGIGLLVDRDGPYKLRYVFDLSDTNSRAGHTITLWQMERRYESEVLESLQNSFGEVEAGDFGTMLGDIAALAVDDNFSDYLTDLNRVKGGSLLEELDDRSTVVWLKSLLKNSVTYMALSRCGYDAGAYFSPEDFARVIDFNTPETVSILGAATSDISEMVLREIGETVKSLQKAEKNKNRTFVETGNSGYNGGRNQNNERSNEHGADIHEAGRLSDPRSDRPGEPDAWQIWDAAQRLPERPPERSLHWDAAVRQAEQPSGGDRRAGESHDGQADRAAQDSQRRDGADEGGRSDEMGRADELDTSLGGGDRSAGADLQLSAALPTEEEQKESIEEAEDEKASAFVISQEEIDAILTRGSGISQGKYRIYEQYLKKESSAENITFLRDEYGWGGAYPAATVNGARLDESHDGKGIKISKGSIMTPDASILLPWKKVEKRIGELIAADRYLNQAEKEFYPQYRRDEDARKARGEIAQEFRSIIYDYNDFVEQLGEKEKQVNLYYLSDCWQHFSIGEKIFHARDAKGEFILPAMRDAMNYIIADNTHLTERCKAMLESLNSPIARLLEPTYDELNPPPEPEKEYRLSLGDAVYLGSHEYEILSLGEDAVVLYDTEYPLFQKELTREEFDRQIAENPLNDKYLHEIETSPVTDNTQARISLNSGDDLVHWIYFNPDAAAGGQYVSGDLAFSVFEELIEQYDLENHPENADAFRSEIEEMSDQFLADINTSFFLEAENDYGMDYDYIEFTPENLLKIHEDILSFTADREAQRETDRYEAEFGADGTRVFRPSKDEEPDNPLLEQAKALINAYCEKEFDSEGDFSDLTSVGLAYTTTEDEEHDLQVNADLVNARLLVLVDGQQISAVQYNSLADLNDFLDGVSFDDLYGFAEELYTANIQDVVQTGEGQLLPEEIPADQEEEYRLLYRLNQDCRYYLGNGLRADNRLWAGNVPEQIAKMRELYDNLRQKPIWLDRETIDRYEREMSMPDRFAPDAEEAKRAVEAMDKAGFRYDSAASNSSTHENIVFLGDDNYPITFENWQEVYAWIDGAELKGTPGLWEQVQQILHPELTEKAPEPLLPPVPKKERVTPHILHPEIHSENRINFRIQDDNLGVDTPLRRYEKNIAAIRLLHKLEQEDRLANTEEQKILSEYVGWGGLADCFEEKSSHYLELKSVLTEEEYAAARESTLTAFYTPPVVIKAMYQALENVGFQTGNILEPSCGVGNFMGLLPESMGTSKLYGVELDSVSGRIAQQLYQKNSIAVQGFEKTELPDSFFDAAIGNVPFGQFKVPDKRYDKNNFLIHDYFFARTLDKVRPGGVIAFVTSKGTMDKENPAVRKYIAQRADLLGAIRLPNNTFKGAAGTEVTSDILFLQKRDSLIDIEPDWVHLGTDANGIKMNRYFIDNPDMILGEMREVSGPYGPESACIAYDGQELSDLLAGAVQNIHGQMWEYDLDELTEEEDQSIPADPTVRNFSYTLVDGKIYFRTNSRMNPVEVSNTAESRIKGLIGVRDCVRQLIEYQTEDYPDSMIKTEQEKLNELYDAFSKKYGLINSRANSSAFNSDSAYCLLSSLEVLDDEGNFIRKADMFTKRTIKQRVVVTSVDTASEALALSLAEKAKVDMTYMMGLTGKPEREIFDDLRGVIFMNPVAISERDGETEYLPADEYLSGNVREKLAIAKRSAELYPEDYTSNVEALEAVQPVDLTASEISVRLGATWIPPEDVENFMFELFGTPRYCQWNIHIHYSQYTGEWNIEGKSYDRVNVKANNTYGTGRINGYKIVEETLNLRDVRIFDYIEDAEGRRTAVLNKKETAIAQGKQELIKQAFIDWIWSDPERRSRLTKLYNENFNSVRPREYDGSHLNFVGINPEINLRPHQRNAIAHIIYGGNTLLAHVVGAGKTFEMVAAAQESKRLGLCQKSLIVVPNHLTEQWASEYLQLYPSANILVATKKDFETKNRKKFCSRIATGDYDAIIIGHSQFEKIPMSIERQRAILEQQKEEILDGIAELKRNRGDSFSIKQMERTKKSVQQKLDKLNDQTRKDDVVTFEELGVDRIFVDEAHYYKNLAAFTKMRNVGGISQTEAMKSSDLYMKCRYLDEITGGRGVVFATGTPISNSMVEMYTMQKYLQYGTLKRNNLIHFDAWASTFGETVTAIELAPEGTGYRAKTRFAKFYNLPELMSMFKETADIQTADMLNLPVPKANYHNVVLKPSEKQKDMVASLSDRAERVRNKMVDSSLDNMLLITNDGRKLALDQRLMNPMLPDSDTGKVAACADNVFGIWQKTADARSTQMVFCDLSTPHGDGEFNVYDDLRDKLIAKGVPAEEIAYIHTANTEAQKKELFGKVRSGQIRVLIGSTQKMGAGTNVQQKLVALHHLDCPWRPSDLQQREGRIVRQGNDNPEVDIFTYVTENTFDSYLYQLVESKQKFIGQIMTSKSPVRSAEDIDETALSYAEIKALCTGNPYIKEKMDLDIDVQRLKLLKANHLSQRYALEDKIIKEFPQQIASYEQRIEGYRKDMQLTEAQTAPNEDGFCPMEIESKLYTEKKAAGSAILEVCHALKNPAPIPLGRYRGFPMELSFDSFTREYKITLIGTLRHSTGLGTDIYGNILRLDNLIAGFPDKLRICEEQLENAKAQLANAKVEVQKPFPKEDELKEKSARLDELNILLNMDKRENELADDGPEDGEQDTRQSDRSYER